MGSLKSFIKAVRAAKTLADERTVIQKESAAIRTSFRDQAISHSTRRANVAKLLYLFTLGERTHFGQVECLKLIASPQFADKRLGYLGTMLLLDENQEVLMLITNSLDTDLTHPNQYVVSLALCTLANIASTSMARDLFPRIEKLITSSNSYLKKKAALCALRIVRRVPELEEMFIEHCKMLLAESNHGVLLCGASLATDMLDNNPAIVTEFAPLLPHIIGTLRKLSNSGFSPEYDVQGIPDPYVQTRLIRLLRAIGQDNADLSEQMSDILAAVATNTDSSKNVGNAVLYEAVLAIFGIEAESSLRVLGINILGKFLSNRDNNTRYVALNTLLKVVSIEPVAVQRHRATIIECFSDPDVSIKRRALELSYALINEQNVRVMVRELLTFLETSDPEFKTQIVSEIALASERFAPNKRWHIDTLLRAFSLAGSQTKENILNAFILLVIGAPDLQLYTIEKLYVALKRDMSQWGLVVVALWLICEYADQLLKAPRFNYDDQTIEVSESSLVDLVLAVFSGPNATPVIQEYCINGLVKLSTRLSSASQLERIRVALQSREDSLNTEIQQRAVEYSVLFTKGGLRKGVLAKMPAPEFGEDLEQQHAKAMSRALVRRRKRIPISGAGGGPSVAAKKAVADLLDLGDDISQGGSDAQGAASADLLADIFGTGSQHTSGTSGAKAASTQAGVLDLFEQPASSASGLGQSGRSDESHTAYEGPHVGLKFVAHKESAGCAVLRAIFSDRSGETVHNLVFQAAVPKSQKLSLQPLSSSTILPGQQVEQNMKVTGPEGASLRLRLRLSYTCAGSDYQEQLDFSKLPQGLL